MKRIIDYFRGCCRLTLRGCEPERCLDRFLSAGLAFWDVEKTDEFTLCLIVYKAEISLASALAQRCQCEAEVQRLHSFWGDFSGLRRRWVLLLGLVAVLVGMVFLPNFIVAYEVEGCETLEPERVLRALSELGVGFGTWGPSIESQQLRNDMLRLVPELRWIAVNRSGLRATVQVVERRAGEPILERSGASNLIADADGIITQMRVLSGQPTCQSGDAVRAGEVLVSGIVDLERCTMTTRALGEVYADTRRQITTLMPKNRQSHAPESIAGCGIYLCAGRKRIKMCGSSGIFMGDCVKIIRRAALRLPGGYEVPVALCIETYYHTAGETVRVSKAAAQALLRGYTDRWIDHTLVAAQVLRVEDAMDATSDAYCLKTTLHCHEMIARSAEIPILEMEINGTNDKRGADGASD